jgi:HEAT repeat protein
LSRQAGNCAFIVQDLIEQLNDADATARLRAATALRALGAKAVHAVPALTAATRDGNTLVRKMAGLALNEIEPKVSGFYERNGALRLRRSA